MNEIPRVGYSHLESPLPCSPSPPASEPIAENRQSTLSDLRAELQGYVNSDGRINDNIPQEIISFFRKNVSALNETNLKDIVIETKRPYQLVGGTVRDLLYKDPSFFIEVLEKLKVSNPNSYKDLLSSHARRTVPDIDVRGWPFDTTNMDKWDQLLREKFKKVHHYCNNDGQGVSAKIPKQGCPVLDLNLVSDYTRETLFVHDLILNICGSEFTDVQLNQMTPQEFWQAVIDLVTRRLHVNDPEKVNYDGLPILISYYLRGWTLGDAHVEPIFFDKFKERADRTDKIVSNFFNYFQKFWEDHHFKDPEAAIALAFNFCTVARGREGIEDTELLTIIQGISKWFPEGTKPRDNVLWKILELARQKNCTLQDLYNLVYTQGVLGSSKPPTLLDHQGKQAFQFEILGKHEPINLLIPEQYCQISSKGSEKEFFKTIGDPHFQTRSENLGLAAHPLWERAVALLSEDQKTLDQINRACGALILSQLLQPAHEKGEALLRHLPRMLNAQSNHETRLSLLSGLKHAFGETYADLLLHAEKEVKDPFKPVEFLLEWIKILAKRKEERIRNVSWDLWNTVAPRMKKGRAQKEQELFALYLPHDLEKSVALFLSFGRSLSPSAKLPFWTKLCKAFIERDRKVPLELFTEALEFMGEIPLDLKNGGLLHSLHARLFSILMEQQKPESIYPLMKQALSFNMLHQSISNVKNIWLQLCECLLEINPEEAFEAFNLGRRKCFFVDSSEALLEFHFNLAESLINNGSRTNAAALIDLISKFSQLKPNFKIRLLALRERVPQNEFTGLEKKHPKQVADLYQKWLKLPEPRSSETSKAALDFIRYYSEKDDAKTIHAILCHQATRGLFKSHTEFLLPHLYNLVVKHKARIECVKLLFDHFEHFDESQKTASLLAAYEDLNATPKLPDSIKQHFLKHATLLIQCSLRRFDCFDFLKAIGRQVTLDCEGWSYLLKEAANVEDKRLLHKLIVELKESGCPVDYLNPLVERALAEMGPETLNRIKAYASWEGYDTQNNLSLYLLDYLDSLEPKKSVSIAINERKLLEAVIPRAELISWVEAKMDECCCGDAELTIMLAMEYRFLKGSILVQLLEEAIPHERGSLQFKKTKDLSSRAFRHDFELKGDPEIIGNCWLGYLNLCVQSNDRGMIHYVKQAIDESTPFAKALALMTSELKTEILSTLAMIVLGTAKSKEQFDESLPFIDELTTHFDPSQEWIESLVLVYLQSSNPDVFVRALRHLNKLAKVEDVKLYSEVFTSFASLARKYAQREEEEQLVSKDYAQREEIEQLVSQLFVKAVVRKRFSKKIPFAAAFYEGVSMSKSQDLITLAYQFLEHMNERPKLDDKTQIGIKDFLISLLESDVSELQLNAEKEIRTGALVELFPRELIAELWFNMVHLKIENVLKTNSDLNQIHLLMEECLRSFDFVSKTKYHLSVARTFMVLLARCNSSAKDKNLEVFSDLLLKYAKAMNRVQPEYSIPTEHQELATSKIFLDCSKMESKFFPDLADQASPCQVLVMETAMSEVVNYDNRVDILTFAVKWMANYMEIEDPVGCQHRKNAIVSMIYQLFLWTKGLTIGQISEHMQFLLPLFCECYKREYFQERLDLLLQIAFMLSPAIDKPLLSLAVYPPLILLENFNALVLKLIRNLEPPSFSWAMIVIPHFQSMVFRNDQQALDELILEVLKEYIPCFLKHPDWCEEVVLRGKINVSRSEYDLIYWLGFMIKKRGDNLKEIHGSNLVKYYAPLLSQLVKVQLQLCEILHERKDAKRLFDQCNTSAEVLLDPDTWITFLGVPMAYWKMVNVFVDLALRVFDNPELSMKEAIKISSVLLFFFGTAGNEEVPLLRPPFWGYKLHENVCKQRLFTLLKIASVLLKYFKSSPEGQANLDQCIVAFKSWALNTDLFPDKCFHEKAEFLKLL